MKERKNTKTGVMGESGNYVLEGRRRVVAIYVFNFLGVALCSVQVLGIIQIFNFFQRQFCQCFYVGLVSSLNLCAYVLF